MNRLAPLAVLAMALLQTGESHAQAWSRDALLQLDQSQLLSVYSTAGGVVRPAGRVRGTPIVAAGTDRAPRLSRGARLMWQGKTFQPKGSRAVNRFFGVPSVPANVLSGPSWLDGRPALILDYQDSSFVYRNVRDEIRQVSPGLYLGLMYDRSANPPTLTRLFILEDTP